MQESLVTFLERKREDWKNHFIVQNSPLKMIMVPSVGFFIVAQRQPIYKLFKEECQFEQKFPTPEDFYTFVEQRSQWNFCFETTESRRLAQVFADTDFNPNVSVCKLSALKSSDIESAILGTPFLMNKKGTARLDPNVALKGDLYF
jgi:hypothetical protein